MFSLIALLAAAGPISSVPIQFQGDWRLSKAECPPATTDQPVWIDGNRIRIDHSVGEVRVFEAVSPHEITVTGELLSDGDPWNAKLRLELSESDRTLTISEGNWLVKLLRCPEVKANK